MANIIKLDINNIEIDKFTKLLDKLKDSHYTIWEGRILCHKSKSKSYSYENLLNIFKSLKEKRDADADKLRNLRSKLLNMDKPADDSYSKKIKEFFHAVVSHFNGTHTDKDDILDTWMEQEIDENQEPETENEAPSTDKQEDKIEQNEITPVVIPEETEVNNIFDLDDEESSLSEDDLFDGTPNDLDSDQLNQENSGTGNNDQTDPAIIPVDNNDVSDETTVTDQPLIKIPGIIVENPASELVIPETDAPSTQPAQGYTKWHLLGVGVITFVATVIFDKLVRSHFPGGEASPIPNSLTCPVPDSLAQHKETYTKLCTLSQDNKPFFDTLNSGFQELDELKVTNNGLNDTIGKLKIEVLQKTQRYNELSKGTKGLNDPQILLEIEKDTNSKDIEEIKSALHWIKKIAKNDQITGDALSNSAIDLVERTIKKFIISDDRYLQMKALEALFTLYNRKNYVINKDFELHTVFTPLVSAHKIDKDNLSHLTMLIRNAKFASKEIRTKTIKNFIMELNLHDDLVDENLVKFFDDLLQEHLVQKGNIQEGLTTVEGLFNKGKKARAFDVLANMLTGFAEQSKDAQIQISNGIFASVKNLDDLKLVNQLFEKLESLDAGVEQQLINTLKTIPVGVDDALGNMHKILKHLARLNSDEIHFTISKEILVKINSILKDINVPCGKKIVILNEFVNGFDSLRAELTNELAFSAIRVAGNEIEWNQGVPLTLLNNLLRLKSFGPYFQLIETVLDSRPTGMNGKVIFMLEKFVKKSSNLRAPDINEGHKLDAATLAARLLNKGATQDEFLKLSAILKELNAAKLTDSQKAALIDKHKEVFISDATLQAFVDQHSGSNAKAMIDILTYSPFEDTSKRLPKFAKMLLEIGTKNWWYSTSPSDYEKHGVGLDILADLVPQMQDKDGKEFLKKILEQTSQEADKTKKPNPEISKELYSKSIKLRLAMLQSNPSQKLLKESHDHIRPMSFAEFAQQYPVELRAQAFKDYAAIFKVLHVNKRTPSTNPLLGYMKETKEEIDIEIARALLEIASLKNIGVDFPDKLCDHSSSILNRVEKDQTASPVEKLSIYKEYMEATFIHSTKADITRIVNLFDAEAKKPGNQKTLEEMVDILDRTITPTVDKVLWAPIRQVLIDLKRVVSDKGPVVDAILKRLI